MKIILFSLLSLALLLSNASAQSVQDGVYILRFEANPKYVLDLSYGRAENTSNVHLWSYTGALNQQWRLRQVGTGLFTICSMVDNNYVLDVDHAVMANGTNIFVHQFKNGSNQKWVLTRSDNAYVLHSWADFNYVIDLDHQTTQNGANIHLWEANGSAAQRWILQLVSTNGGGGGSTSTSQPVEQGSFEPGAFFLYQHPQHPAQKVQCRNCKGTTLCTACNGEKYTDWAYSYRYGKLKCAVCNSGMAGAIPGKCFSCGGESGQR